MSEYVCVTLLADPGESAPAFKSRLVVFWTHMLRTHPVYYEMVYAEATEFETDGDRVSRQYMVEPDAISVLTLEASTARIASMPVDREDLYSKAEASSSDWFQIEH